MSQSLVPLEAIMWRAGHDPALRMTVGNLVVLDRLPDVDELVARVAAAAMTAPRLSWRLDDPSRSRVRPSWVGNPEFDARDHVRIMAVPPPGGERQVLDLIALVESSQFEPTRSPWDVTVIEGLEGGRVALYLRADHVLTDGVGGAELVALLLDPVGSVRASPPEQQPPPEQAPDPPPLVAERRAGTVSVTVDLTTIARPVAAGITAARSVDPIDTLVRSVQRGVDMVSSVSRQLVVPGGPLSTLNPSGSIATRFEMLSVADARSTALRLGGSRNDLLVAAAAAALGAYHERIGRPVAELRLAAPMLVRAGRSGGANSFSPIRTEIPAASGHAGSHFGMVADRLARARREPAARLTFPLSAAIGLLPGRALLPALRAQINSVDFIATALPGRRTFGTICGAAIESTHPFGPRAGRLVNITALGNADRLDLGIALDPGAIREPEVLVGYLRAAFERLAADADEPGVD